MLRFLTFMIFLSSLYGIVPPKDGKLSTQILENLKNQDIGNLYGDPGWVNKISNFSNEPGRNTQMEFFMPVILGKYADVSDTCATEQRPARQPPVESLDLGPALLAPPGALLDRFRVLLDHFSVCLKLLFALRKPFKRRSSDFG